MVGCFFFGSICQGLFWGGKLQSLSSCGRDTGWAGDLIFLFELIFESYFEVGQWSCLFHVANCKRNSTRCISVILQILACSTAD